MPLPSQQPLSQEEKDGAKQIFEHISGGRGKITHADLKTAFTQFGWDLSDDEIKGLVERADTGKTGYISFEEFFKVCESRPILRRVEAGLRRLFDDLDADASGFITRDNLKAMATKQGAPQLSDEQLDGMIAKADKTGDGKISFEEFVNAIMPMM